jgi:hypothetical protein
VHRVDAPSTILSLDWKSTAARIAAPSSGIHTGFTHVNVRRLKEMINGREYLIEVSSIGADKWRAQIRRIPGGSSAMMPFYGSTPDEAAAHLSRWLTKVNRPRI